MIRPHPATGCPCPSLGQVGCSFLKVVCCCVRHCITLASGYGMLSDVNNVLLVSPVAEDTVGAVY